MFLYYFRPLNRFAIGSVKTEQTIENCAKKCCGTALLSDVVMAVI